MKNFLTVNDIEAAIKNGQQVICLGPDDVVTSAAHDYAQQKGVSFQVLEQGSLDSGGQAPGQSSSSAAVRFPVANSGIRRAAGGILSEEDILRWRKEFPILQDVVHVANCSQSAQSHRVRNAVNRYLDNWLTVGMDWDYWMEEMNRGKREFAKLINAEPEEIAISSSVSDAVSSIASGLDYSGARNKVVTTEIEFPTVGHVWLAHQKYGYDLQFIPVQGEEIPLEAYERYVDERTILTSITQVYYRNGFKQDIDAILDICHRKGSLVLIDAYQGLGTHPIDVKKQKIDIITSGCCKYLFGTPGMAFTYVNKDLIPYLEPAHTGWWGQENPFSFEVRKLNYASDARRFDTGTPNVLVCFAVTAGLSIANEITVPAIAERIDYLSQVAINKADQLGLKCVSPRDIRKKGGTTAIEINMNSHEMEVELRKRNIIASARGSVIRVAPHFYTLPHEVEFAMEQIRSILDQNRL